MTEKISQEEKLIKQEERHKKKWEETHKFINNINHKICSICKEWSPSTTEYFYKNDKNGIDGLNPYCKECTSKKSYKWKLDNPEKVVINRRNLRERDPERVRLHRRTSYENNLEVEKERLRNWQKENPNQVKYNNQKRNAHKKHTISNKEWEECKKYFNHRCAYCGLLIEEHFIRFKGETILGDFHKEHFYDDGANDLSNCVPSCKSCNSSKSEFDFEYWYEISGHFSIEKKDKIIKWIEEDYKQYIQFKAPKKQAVKI